MIACRAVLLSLLCLALPPAAAQERGSFRFESVDTIGAMKDFVRSSFPPGAPRAALRRVLADEGGGSWRQHPRRPGTEKYLYDINICDAYIWRWNISADFDAAGALTQVYVNGDPVHASGPQKIDPRTLQSGGKAAIFKGTRARPEAHRGEKQLAYLLLDGDADPRTVDDQLVMGAGPTSPEPGRARMLGYTDVELWRSIFDPDPADRIVRRQGACPQGW